LQIQRLPYKRRRENSELSSEKVQLITSLRVFNRKIEELMPPKINWIENLRGIACLMVVMIHTTTWYITHAASVSTFDWGIANFLNSASRVSVPLFL
jgi:hypothetical protein